MAGEIAKQHQRFAEGIHRHRDVFDFLGQSDRPPELAKIIAAERPRPDLHDVVPTEFARSDHLFSPPFVIQSSTRRFDLTTKDTKFTKDSDIFSSNFVFFVLL
jgi:hypothetical protein